MQTREENAAEGLAAEGHSGGWSRAPALEEGLWVEGHPRETVPQAVGAWEPLSVWGQSVTVGSLKWEGASEPRRGRRSSGS